MTCGPKLGCALVWPPEFITATGKPVAGTGVKQSLLGSDPDPYAPGKHVVTYKGWPLYLYKGDHKNGTATGQDTKGAAAFGTSSPPLARSSSISRPAVRPRRLPRPRRPRRRRRLAPARRVLSTATGMGMRRVVALTTGMVASKRGTSRQPFAD